MSKRDAIIWTAAQLIHEKGYHNVGIKSILDALEIPKGSFYHYFPSKEALGLAIIDVYIKDVSDLFEGTEPDLEGLKSFFNVFFDRLIALSMTRGCPVGNLILELADENEQFRLKLLDWYKVVETFTIHVLENHQVTDPIFKAKALISSFEGAMLLSKLDKEAVHFKIFNEITLSAIIEK